MSDGEEPNRYGPKGTALVPVQPANPLTPSEEATTISAAVPPPRTPLSDIPPTAPAGVHPLTAQPSNPRPAIPPTMIRDPYAAPSGPPPAPPPPPSNQGGTQALPPSAFAPRIPAPAPLPAIYPPAPPPPFTAVPDDVAPITEPGVGGPESAVHAAQSSQGFSHSSHSSSAANVSVPRPPPPRARSSRLSLVLIGVGATIVLGSAATALALHLSSNDDEPDPPVASVPTAKPKVVQADPPPTAAPAPTAPSPSADPRDPRDPRSQRGDPPPDGPPPGPRKRRRPRNGPPPQW